MSELPRSPQSTRLVRFGVFEFDPHTGDLWKSGRRIRLADQPRQVLRMLVLRPGELVSREELRRALWPDDTFVDFDTGLNVVINRIRQVLDDSASTPRFIETLARRGYRFIAPVSALGAAAPAAPVEHPAAGRSGPPPAANSRRRGRRTTTIAAVLTIVVAGAIAGVVTSRRSPPVQSIAVLPFRNVSPDASEAWFAEAMTDAVISSLARISALRVISMQSSMSFQNSREPMSAISRKLGADALIEGSASLIEGRIRLTVRLVHGPTERLLWSDTYERSLSDVLALQSDLAQAVADQVRVTLSGEEHTSFGARRPVNPDAYALYMRAGHFFNLRSPAAVKKSIEYYQQAIALDPEFAAAYGGMALSYCLLIETGPAKEAYRPVKAAAARALARDPTQVDALVAMTQAAFYGDRDWREAKKNLESILQRYPNHPTAHSWYASLLTEIGPLEQALAERRRAYDIDPLSVSANNSMGAVLTQMGRYDESVKWFTDALELDPGYADARGWLGFAHLKMGKRDEAIADMERCARDSHNHVRMVARLASTYGLVGRASDAQRLLQTLSDRSKTEYVPPIWFAHIYAGLGDFDRAFGQLEEAYRQGGPTLMRLKSDPMLDPLKGDPRFADLVRRLQLPWP